MTFNLKSILEQWKKKLSPGSHIVLSKYFDFCLYVDKTELVGIISSFLYHIQTFHYF